MSAPHFLLYTETHNDPNGGRWRFSLRRHTGRVILEAADVEPDLAGPRLELLATVRGLEALECPARLLLLTPSNYVRRGIEYGIESWRQSDWTWEWFGQMAPVKNRDLWQRVDRAMHIHDVHCRRWRLDGAHARVNQPNRIDAASASVVVERTGPIDPTDESRAAARQTAACEEHASEQESRGTRQWRRLQLEGKRWLSDQADSWWLRVSQLGSQWLPQPWLK